jgi:hypothetical protein
MGKLTLPTFAAMVLATALLGQRVEATMPSVLGAAAPVAGLVHEAAVVCGNGGCAPVQVKRMQKHQMPKTPGLPLAPLPTHPAS